MIAPHSLYTARDFDRRRKYHTSLEGSHFALFCFTKSTHFFSIFFACDRSSPKYGIEWSAIHFSKSGVLLQPPATHLVGILAANSSRATQPLQ